jgi:hypothetical protein
VIKTDGKLSYKICLYNICEACMLIRTRILRYVTNITKSESVLVEIMHRNLSQNGILILLQLYRHL